MCNYKYFSPSYTRTRYIKKLQSFSEEFCHNVMRLILRPNHPSAKHWFIEMLPWINKAIRIRLDSKSKPLIYLFDEVTDISKGKYTWSRDFIEIFYYQVKDEPYGKIKELSFNEVENLFESLYETLLYMDDSMDLSEIRSQIYKWYLTIPNASKKFI